MAESSSSALPGGVEWLPTLGGARLLRVEVRGAPPVLVLHAKEGDEQRIEPGPQARFDGTTTYLVPAGTTWSRASLAWPDGTRAALPSQADVIALPRRPVETPLPPRPEPLPWTAPPWAGASDTEVAATAWAARRATFEQALAAASEAMARIADGERSTREAVLAILDSARSDVQAARTAARAGEVSLRTEIGSHEVTRGEVEAERASHEATRGEVEAERASHEATRGELVAERASHEATRGELVAERASHEATREELEAERGAHEMTLGALEAERTAHAETRETLAEALAAARAARDTAGESAELDAIRAELAAARAEAEIGADARAHLASARRDAALARAEVATLRADLEAERAARARAEAALAGAGDDAAYLERVAKLDRDVEGLRSQVRIERRAREQAEAAAAAGRRPPAETGRLVANLDAAAAALRAAATPLEAAPPPATAPPDGAARPDGAAPPDGAARPDGAAPPDSTAAIAASAISSSPTMYRGGRSALAPPERDRGLRRALAGLAAEDPVAAGTLIAALLPAQGAVIEDTLTYDLTIRGIGTFAVFVADGAVRVQRITRRRGRGESAFHLSAEPLALARLLAGEDRKVRRFGRAARFSGRRKQLRALAKLPAARLSLADAVRAGARLEPSLVYRALPFAVPADWTRGHVFTVAQEITELAPRAWYITARDGVPLRVIEYAAGAAADATVTMSLAAFERLLRREPALAGDRPAIRGDHGAVAALKRWTDLIV